MNVTLPKHLLLLLTSSAQVLVAGQGDRGGLVGWWDSLAPPGAASSCCVAEIRGRRTAATALALLRPDAGGVLVFGDESGESAGWGLRRRPLRGGPCDGCRVVLQRCGAGPRFPPVLPPARLATIPPSNLPSLPTHAHSLLVLLGGGTSPLVTESFRLAWLPSSPGELVATDLRMMAAREFIWTLPRAHAAAVTSIAQWGPGAAGQVNLPPLPPDSPWAAGGGLGAAAGVQHYSPPTQVGLGRGRGV